MTTEKSAPRRIGQRPAAVQLEQTLQIQRAGQNDKARRNVGPHPIWATHKKEDENKISKQGSVLLLFNYNEVIDKKGK